MKIWTAMRRLNQSYDAWAIRALDHRGVDSSKPEAKKHISVWDLLSHPRDPVR